METQVENMRRELIYMMKQNQEELKNREDEISARAAELKDRQDYLIANHVGLTMKQVRKAKQSKARQGDRPVLVFVLCCCGRHLCSCSVRALLMLVLCVILHVPGLA